LNAVRNHNTCLAGTAVSRFHSFTHSSFCESTGYQGSYRPPSSASARAAARGRELAPETIDVDKHDFLIVAPAVRLWCSLQHATVGHRVGEFVDDWAETILLNQ
jgi:hypothetical protein